MALIKSISGIRGTIGGAADDSLSPLDVVKYTSAYAAFLRQRQHIAPQSNTIVVGRDARISGEIVKNLVCSTLQAMGYDVLYIGLAATPTTELAVLLSHAAGGIIITASHNPRQWNALKLLNEKGEFLSADDGQEVLSIAAKGAVEYADVDHLGTYTEDNTFADKHIQTILALPLVQGEAIKKARLTVAVDTINSVGTLVVPPLLDALGVEYTIINAAATGDFAHNPEPLEENLDTIMSVVEAGHYDMGIVVDPDVDRLALITEQGKMFGEEFTLVSVADYVLSHTQGNTVSNLSSTRALRDITRLHRGRYAAAAVGEVNVVEKMKEVGAVIGGEGNGGVIYPECHYGRDALVGIALFLSCIAERQVSLSQLRASLPAYHMAKNKIQLLPTTDVDAILSRVKERYNDAEINDIDGVKIDFPDRWVHLRRSNTEPIIRIYSEAPTEQEANSLAEDIMNVITSMQQ